jgi:hypothetical protein
MAEHDTLDFASASLIIELGCTSDLIWSGISGEAKLLRVARMVFAAAAITSPCRCDDCSHCQELAKVSVEIEAVSIHASARLAWLDGRVKEPDIVVRVRIPSSPQTKSKRTSS